VKKVFQNGVNSHWKHLDRQAGCVAPPQKFDRKVVVIEIEQVRGRLLGVRGPVTALVQGVVKAEIRFTKAVTPRSRPLTCRDSAIQSAAKARQPWALGRDRVAVIRQERKITQETPDVLMWHTTLLIQRGWLVSACA
jgi:hypothetical protein